MSITSKDIFRFLGYAAAAIATKNPAVFNATLRTIRDKSSEERHTKSSAESKNTSRHNQQGGQVINSSA